jgi:hypothetical protein
MKPGDLYSYANISLQSHGYSIRTNRDFSYELIGNYMEGFVLDGTVDNKVKVKPDESEVLRLDDRFPNDRSNYIMVYPAGMPEEHITNTILRQLEAVLKQHVEVYQTLYENAKAMLAECSKGKTDHLCPPGLFTDHQ